MRETAALGLGQSGSSGQVQHPQLTAQPGSLPACTDTPSVSRRIRTIFMVTVWTEVSSHALSNEGKSSEVDRQERQDYSTAHLDESVSADLFAGARFLSSAQALPNLRIWLGKSNSSQVRPRQFSSDQ